VRITYDPAKREKTLAKRGIDYADTALVFAGEYITVPDNRGDYGEPRFISVGELLAGSWWSLGPREAAPDASYR
jgi:uncharacterized protein